MSVPDEVRSAAIAAFLQHDPSVEVADLVDDSLLDEAKLDPAKRTLAFACGSHRVDVTVAPSPTGLVIDLRLSPPENRCVQLKSDRGERETVTDVSGRARLADVPSGLMSLRVQDTHTGRPLFATAWVRV